MRIYWTKHLRCHNIRHFLLQTPEFLPIARDCKLSFCVGPNRWLTPLECATLKRLNGASTASGTVIRGAADGGKQTAGALVCMGPTAHTQVEDPTAGRVPDGRYRYATVATGLRVMLLI